jgi:hypothetical protein
VPSVTAPTTAELLLSLLCCSDTYLWIPTNFQNLVWLLHITARSLLQRLGLLVGQLLMVQHGGPVAGPRTLPTQRRPQHHRDISEEQQAV